MEEVEGIDADRCSFCEGFFVDAAELEALFLEKGAEQRRTVPRRLPGI